MTPQNLTVSPTSPSLARVFEASPFRQLSTIREMLGTLDTLTMAGQRHIMAKVVSFIRANGSQLAQLMGCSDDGLVGDLLGRLALESERLAPDARRFGQQAHNLVDLLGGGSSSQVAA